MKQNFKNNFDIGSFGSISRESKEAIIDVQKKPQENVCIEADENEFVKVIFPPNWTTVTMPFLSCTDLGNIIDNVKASGMDITKISINYKHCKELLPDIDSSHKYFVIDDIQFEVDNSIPDYNIRCALYQGETIISEFNKEDIRIPSGKK